MRPSWLRMQRFGWIYWLKEDDITAKLDDKSIYERLMEDGQNKRNRKKALKNAEKFLSPYTELFGNHCLTNSFCQVTLSKKSNQFQLVCYTLKNKDDEPKKVLLAISDDEFKTDMNEIWNLICWDYSEYTTYIDVYEKCRIARLVIKESVFGSSTGKIEREAPPTLENIVKEQREKAEVSTVDVNTATENELKALPGINIMLAKKIIMERKKSLFLSKVDFFGRMKISENSMAVLINCIRVEKPEKPEGNNISEIKPEDKTADENTNKEPAENKIQNPDERIVDL